MSASDVIDSVDVGLTERSHLLSSQPQKSDLDSNRDGTTTKQSLRLTVIGILLLQFFTMFAFYHVVAPKLRLLELTLCRAYYLDHDPSLIELSNTWPGYRIQESKCKNSAIQRELSRIRSWGVLLDGLCLFVVSIPYGMIADKYGRRAVYALGILGLILSNTWVVIVFTYLPIQAILVSSAFLVVGGGSSVLLSMTNTMAADVCSEELRSTVFYLLLSAYYMGYIMGSGLAPATIRTPWVPFALALIALIIALTILVWLRNTMKTALPGEGSGRDNVRNESKSTESIYTTIRETPGKFADFIDKHRALAAVMVLFPLMAIRGPFAEIVIPYVSRRYGWTIGQASALDAINGSIALVLGTLVLPALVDLLRRWIANPVQADCLVAIYSSATMAIGSIVIALSPHIALMLVGWVLWSMGFGVRMAVLAMTNSFVRPEQLARLNTAVLCTETLADIAFSPLIWRAWGAGLDMPGKFTLGLPWFVVASGMIIVSVTLSFLYRTLGSTQTDP